MPGAMDRKILERLARLQEEVDTALLSLNEETSTEYIQNTIVYLEEMKENLKRYHSLLNKRKPVIGIFGVPNVGKSTLLNVLLGFELLPMKNSHGTTRFGTEISYQDNKSGEPVTITYKYENKQPETKYRTLKGAAEELAYFAKNQDNNYNVSKIEIKCPFKTYIGNNNIVFVDTPGIVYNAGKDDLKDHPEIYHDFEKDKIHALSVLSSVDIVIFCMKFPYQNAEDKKIYNEYIRKYEPINIINGSDNKQEGRSGDDIKRELKEHYDLLSDQTVVVSSDTALEIINAPENKKGDIVKIAKKKFTGQDLKGFMELKEKIIKKTDNNDPAIVEERVRRFEELYDLIKEDAKNSKGIIIPTVEEAKTAKEEAERQRKEEETRQKRDRVGKKIGGFFETIGKIFKTIGIIILILLVLVILLFIYFALTG